MDKVSDSSVYVKSGTLFEDWLNIKVAHLLDKGYDITQLKIVSSATNLLENEVDVFSALELRSTIEDRKYAKYVASKFGRIQVDFAPNTHATLEVIK